MKRLLTALFAIALIGVVFTSCKKDDETTFSNSITIQGEIMMGDKTYTNPTFDLGEPTLHEGYVMPNYQLGKPPVANMIMIQPVDENDIDLGDNVFLGYEYNIYTETLGTAASTFYVNIYYDLSKQILWLYSQDIVTTVTKVDEVGGYIEGTFTGTLYPETKVGVTYPVTGVFKVKRVAAPIMGK